MTEQEQDNGSAEEQNDQTQKQKSVDEEWKEQVQKEKENMKQQAEQQQGAQEDYPEASFSSIVAGIGVQTAMSLGQVENPSTGQTEVDLQQAQHLIDSLKILKEKSEGNRTRQEDQHLKSLLKELQMQYVQEAKKRDADGGDGEDAGGGGATGPGGPSGPSGGQGGSSQEIYTP
jgi:hypothetical protein